MSGKWAHAGSLGPGNPGSAFAGSGREPLSRQGARCKSWTSGVR